MKMGTTVATNALLERKGDRTLLLDHQGFPRRAARSATRRGRRSSPSHIIKPEMLYERVAEVDERVRADGTVERALDLAGARADARSGQGRRHRRRSRSCSCTPIAIPSTSRQVAALAREMGFAQVSVSHEVSPLIKLVGRGDTTVVDAYLSPILRRYVAQVAGEWPLTLPWRGRVGARRREGAAPAKIAHPPLSGPPPQGEVKQTPPHVHDVLGRADRGRAVPGQGRDPVGPRGRRRRHGARPGAQAGFDRLIGFDMGGTSTDVSHFDGEYERAFETEVAGVRMRAPMMLIHTVAAGGGSILHFDGARFRVGPDSAGANPGPKCYRRGGPLAVTDANVMVGKLMPDFFPKIFGPQQDQPLDAEAVRAAFAALAKEIGGGRAGRDRRRLHQDRGREHGERDQEDFRAARLRRHALRAQLLRRRRRAARLPRRRRARHDHAC